MFGTAKRPRAVVSRSLKHIYIQFIDDDKGKTLAMASDKDVTATKGMNKTDIASKVGKTAAERAQKVKIKEIIFDRRGYRYHGRVQALADGMREKGLKF